VGGGLLEVDGEQFGLLGVLCEEAPDIPGLPAELLIAATAEAIGASGN